MRKPWIFLVVLLCPVLRAQVSISASDVADSFNRPIPLARLCFTPVNSAVAPQGFRVGAEQVVPNEVCGKVVAGVLESGLTLAPSVTGVYYHVYLKASNANTILRDYCMTSITGGSWSLDSYDPSTCVAVAPANFPAAGLVASTGFGWRAPAFADVVALWAGGSCTSGYLKYDGTCSSAGGGSGITGLVGDATTAASSSGNGVTLTLATVNTGPGACGDAGHVCAVTTNGKGLATAQTATAITTIDGVTVTGTPSSGQVPTATGSAAATWQTPSGGGATNVSCPSGSSSNAQCVTGIPNDSTGGTALNMMACWAGQAYEQENLVTCPAATYGTDNPPGAVGICVAGCGTSGTAVIQRDGPVNWYIDTTVYAGQQIQLSPTTGGEGDCPNGALPGCIAPGEHTFATFVAGRVITGNAGAGTLALVDLEPFTTSAAGGYSSAAPYGSFLMLSAGNGSNFLQQSTALQQAPSSFGLPLALVAPGIAFTNAHGSNNPCSAFYNEGDGQGEDLSFDPFTTGTCHSMLELKGSMWMTPDVRTVNGTVTQPSGGEFYPGASSNIHIWTLAGNSSIWNPSQDNAGDILIFDLVQASSGGPFSWTWPTGGPNWINMPSITTTAGGETITAALFDGTNYICVYGCPVTGSGDTVTSPNSTISVGGTALATTVDVNLAHSNTFTASQTAPHWTAGTGFDITGATTAGHYLRNNGTDYVDSALQAGDVPTLNQSTTGTASNLSGTPALPSGTTATTQAASDNSTKLETTAGTLSKIAVNAVSPFVPPWLQDLGTGADGAVTCNGTTLAGEVNATTFTVGSSGCTVNSIAGLVVHATGAITITGTLTAQYVTTGVCGGASAGSGAGSSNGTAGVSTYANSVLSGNKTSTGGTAGTATNGTGGNASAVSTTGQRGCVNSGGGFDGLYLGGSNGVAGANSGGAAGVPGVGVTLIGQSITGAGTITASGTNGGNCTGNSTGAGSGGGGAPVTLSSQTYESSWPTVNVAAGLSGTAASYTCGLAGTSAAGYLTTFSGW